MNSTVFWSECRDSNSRPLEPHSSAIPNFATPGYFVLFSPVSRRLRYINTTFQKCQALFSNFLFFIFSPLSCCKLAGKGKANHSSCSLKWNQRYASIISVEKLPDPITESLPGLLGWIISAVILTKLHGTLITCTCTGTASPEKLAGDNPFPIELRYSLPYPFFSQLQTIAMPAQMTP